jgi:hypothetical protein
MGTRLPIVLQLNNSLASLGLGTMFSGTLFLVSVWIEMIPIFKVSKSRFMDQAARLKTAFFNLVYSAIFLDYFLSIITMAISPFFRGPFDVFRAVTVGISLLFVIGPVFCKNIRRPLC